MLVVGIACGTLVVMEYLQSRCYCSASLGLLSSCWVRAMKRGRTVGCQNASSTHFGIRHSPVLVIKQRVNLGCLRNVPLWFGHWWVLRIDNIYIHCSRAQVGAASFHGRTLCSRVCWTEVCHSGGAAFLCSINY